MQLANCDITSDNPSGIEILIGVDYFSCFITRQRRVKEINLFVLRGGLIPYELMPKCLVSKKTFYIKHRCAHITCDNHPDVTELLALDRISITKEKFSPAEQETVSAVKANLCKNRIRILRTSSLQRRNSPISKLSYLTLAVQSD